MQKIRKQPGSKMTHSKILHSFLFLTVLLFLNGCAEKISPFDHASNWLIRQNDIPEYFSEFDVFCLPPILETESNGLYPGILPSEREKVFYNDASCLTTLPFGRKCRVFIPKIDTVSLSCYLKMAEKPLEKKQSLTDLPPLKQIMDKTLWALDYYFTHFHSPGRPFILMGDSITSVLLYQAIRECEHITPENGFICAYLPGLPSRSAQQILKDFRKKKIGPARTDNDYGVIATWICTATPPADSPFSGKENYQINPITWRTDSTPGPADRNAYALFYDWSARRLQNRMQKLTHPCSTRIIPEKGCLQVQLKPALADHQLLQTGYPFFHNWNLTFFIGNIARNARRRTEHFLNDRNWKFQDPED